MKREDLRVSVMVDAQVGEGWATVPREITPEEFHQIATAEGYVKLEPLRGDPIAPTREALRFVRFGIANGLETQFVTEDDLRELGYVMSEVDAVIAATRALIAKDEKIERLEAELADTRHVLGLTELARRQMEAELAACEQVREAIAAESRDRYAEIADLRASSVVYKVRCDGRCSPETGAMHHAESCDGWRLAEGVIYEPDELGYVGGSYVIPARLIEGDTK